MAPKIKNIIIFTTIAAAFVLIYIFFIKSPSGEVGLISSPSSLPNVDGTLPDGNAPNETSLVARDFLTLLLNVKNIKLDDNIFSDPAFTSLHNSSITLTPDGTEGRPNPFAQFGNDGASIPILPVSDPTPPAPPITQTPAKP